MRGTRILLVFFLFFTVTSFLIPVPMFPGNLVAALLGERIREYVSILSAMLNGAVYASLLWLVFVGISRKLGQ